MNIFPKARNTEKAIPKTNPKIFKPILPLLLIIISNILTAQEVTLLFAGDAMQHQSQLNNAYRNGAYDYSSYFEYIKEEISSADISIVNLEVTLGGPPFTGYPQFSAPDEYALALKNAGFNIFLNANNHILDRGAKGLIRTLNILDSIQVIHTGAFRNEDERNASYPKIHVCKDIRFALLNYTYGTNGISVRPPLSVNYIDREQIRKDIQKAHTLGAHCIIANMHWGDEHKLLENKEQSDLAHFMAKEGIDLIIGSHPHVVQPSKIIQDSSGNIKNVIVYSLGNFISGMIAPNTDGGQIIKIIIEKQPFHPIKIKSAEYALVFRNKEKQGNKTNFSVIPVSIAEKDSLPSPQIPLDPQSYQKMKTFAKNARTLFNKYNIGVNEYKPKPLQKEEDYIKFFSEIPYTIIPATF